MLKFHFIHLLLRRLTSCFHPAYKSDIAFTCWRLFLRRQMRRDARPEPPHLPTPLCFNVPRSATCSSVSRRTKEPPKRRLTSDTRPTNWNLLQKSRRNRASATPPQRNIKVAPGAWTRREHGQREARVSGGGGVGSGEGGGVQLSGRRCFKRNQGAQKEADY